MARLTEEMVMARTKTSDLGAIKKLNCWGGELTDVSLLRRMTNVEVLSLSVNKITSLSDFRYCRKLRELYVRKNDIVDINEVSYLKSLPALRNLWLGENPCAKTDSYRLTVLKALPYLEKLDDVTVQPEEVEDALKKGRDLINPEECEFENGFEDNTPRTARMNPEYDISYSQDCDQPSNEQIWYTQDDKYYPDNGSYQPPQPSAKPPSSHGSPRRPSQITYESTNPPTNSTDTTPPKVSPSENINYPSNNSLCGKCQSPMSPSSSSSVLSELASKAHADTMLTRGADPADANHIDPSAINHFGSDSPPNYYDVHDTQGGEYASAHVKRSDIENGRRGSSSEGSGRYSPRTNERLSSRALRQAQRDIQDATQRLESERQASAGHLHRKTSANPRTSNLLLAVMCLVKELDYSSLEVLEAFIRLQIEESEN